MKRRKFIILLGGAAIAGAEDALAQRSDRLRHIGMLLPGSSRTHGSYIAAFRQGLVELGYTEGHQFALELALAEGQLDRLPSLASDLVARKVDVIVTGSTQATLAAREATTSIPIVQAGGGDLVRLGVVPNLAHPDGNVTGLNNESSDLSSKLLEMLVLLIPTLSRVGVLSNPRNPVNEWKVANIQEGARSLNVATEVVPVSEKAALDGAFETLAHEDLGGLVVLDDALFVANARHIVDLAARTHLPTVYPFRAFVDAGGLMSYGVSLADNYHRAATFAYRILNGAIPVDLPVEQPTKFQLVINSKAAKTLGIPVSPSILVRADEVIE
ncbi:MAG TPA: ABC transporter substrate-binding protein [Stellaceae bacterium]|nr:ABC transporter substrate-binding protein [Stellaceae bacterium]